MALTVGFDLDMTLLDTRPGIKAAYDTLAAETGTYIDSELVVSRLGPPLAQEMAVWFPADQVQSALDRYRELYPELALTEAGTLVLPGAREALAAVRAAGGRVAVITGKFERNARLQLAHVGMEVDILVGDTWAETKGAALLEHGAGVYVGDHLGDVRGARAAGAVAVGVTTGPYDEAALREAGADVVLGSLTEFPDWLATHLDRAAVR
ncbi:haloacid dehalogenase [Kitasatospora sp. MMS16-BH015]|uniref:HAD family hydrolase n=1 Tax=Kitasatospora sp. MMS16-BH015 TaxID=2018025 RepID=UPI000CA14D90|nr:HAD hydrolase-like protein [Kitasatospora sp. MMS16-BH015]AUG79147.1 haloacid dehalogenase [Kitasatospora sp. MMS16-BH015]